ncbi:hypothetical protein [Fuerstiella marisgermanici]|uniref:hypothetical protein n=1 Tax=Fuerstiella marisgermanici TaxID=1891926 RepID=UPI00097C40B5|nr:hypothetical protein [Fuerstiella marisgermanici]
MQEVNPFTDNRKTVFMMRTAPVAIRRWLTLVQAWLGRLDAPISEKRWTNVPLDRHWCGLVVIDLCGNV